MAQVVEKWIPQAKRHIDLFGFCDILAVHPTLGHNYVQTTSYGNVSARLKKIRLEEKAEVVLHMPNTRIQIHGWHKHGLKGQRKVWKARIIDVSLSEYYEVNENDWTTIYRLMEQVDYMVPRSDSEGFYSCTAILENYPPRIEIFLKDDNEPHRKDSKAELYMASQLIERMVGKATETYDWLILKESWPPAVGGKGYILRPENYSELAEMLKTQLL